MTAPSRAVTEGLKAMAKMNMNALNERNCTDCAHPIAHHKGDILVWAAMAATRRGQRPPGTLRCSVVVKGKACQCGKAKSKPCPHCGGTGRITP